MVSKRATNDKVLGQFLFFFLGCIAHAHILVSLVRH